MKYAIIGSRQGVAPGRAAEVVEKLAHTDPHSAFISGGAIGVDREAEEKALEIGRPVMSLRVHKLGDEEYRVERWILGVKTPKKEILWDEPSFRDRLSALFYRNAAIVEQADEVVALHNGRSSGTLVALDFAHGAERPTHVWREDREAWM